MITQREFEFLYASAYNHYEMGKYTQSSTLFTQLIIENPHEPRFWKGLAASKQMEKNYKEALHAWGVFALLSGHDVTSHFHAAECYLSLGELDEAKKALNCAEHFLKKRDHS